MKQKTALRSLYVVLLTITNYIFGAQAQENAPVTPLTQPQSAFPVGDPRRCFAGNKNLLRLEVIPGGGWDNLRNRDAGMVMKINYTLCSTTDDGRYLVPDGICTIPKKSSKVDTYAELFMHWNNYSSTLSSSINAHAGLNLPHFGISGKFSSEFESVKTHQYFDRSATTRVQARYVRYNAKAQPDFAISDILKARLRKIAAHIETNRTDLATYESQLVVRDFGTHVITSVDIGAAMVQVDQVKSSFLKNTEFEKNEVLASASASFFGVFDAGFDFSHTTTQKMMDQYIRNRTTSQISTFGGPIFRPTNYTSLNWSMSLENDLVALDRSGDPLYYFISSATLPDLPQSTIYKVYDHIKAAIELYYKHNIYRGCTDENAPNFSFMANQDDGSCKPPNTNYTFGGVYQKCTGSGYKDLCAGMRQKNPLTGDFSCPEEYEAVLLQDGSKSSSTTRHECHSCWLLFHCCDDNTYYAHASYSAYWCSAKGHVDQNHGFLFGGLFTSMSFNPLTESMNCPTRFYALRLLQDLVICVSDDYELGFGTSLPFAGLFSCKSGNPLALSTSTSVRSTANQHSLMSYMLEQGSSSWPRECPHGFSQHLAIVDNGCEINYCIKTGALSPKGLPKVKRPPFMPLPHDTYGLDEPAFVFNDDGTMWTSMSKAEKLFGQDTTTKSSHHHYDKTVPAKQGSATMTAGTAAVIGVVATLAGVLMVAVAVMAYRKKRSGLYRETDPWDDRRPINSDTNRQSSTYGGFHEPMTVTNT